jgi:hypothetical protein
MTHPFRSPYQCEECGTRFWVVSRKVRLRAATAVGIVLTGMLVIASGPRLLARDESPTSESPAPTTTAAPALTPNDISAIQQSRLSDSQPAK